MKTEKLKKKNMQNISFNYSYKSVNKNQVNSSLINISKQLNNIYLNDINVLNLSKMNLTNRLYSKANKSHNNIYPSKSLKYQNNLNKLQSTKTDLNFIVVKSESFIIKSDENQKNLLKKNFILKENLKFLVNEIKKYKITENNKNNIDDDIKQYETIIENYIREIKKYKQEIISLKEKYDYCQKENDDLKKFIEIELNKLNNSQLMNSIYKTDMKNQTLIKIQKKKNLKSFKYMNLNLKKYLEKNKKINKDSFYNGNKSSNIIGKPKIININYLLTEDKNSLESSLKNSNKANISINNLEDKFNTNIINEINNTKKNINKIVFNNINSKNKNKIKNTNKVSSKTKINQNTLKENSFEGNKSFNLSQSYRHYNNKKCNAIGRKKVYLNKFNNFIYFNNRTFNE